MRKATEEHARLGREGSAGSEGRRAYPSWRESPGWPSRVAERRESPAWRSRRVEYSACACRAKLSATVGLSSTARPAAASASSRLRVR